MPELFHCKEDGLKWAMPFAALFLCFVTFALIISGIATGGWLSVPFYVAACGVAYLIDERYRKSRADDWKQYVMYPIVAIAFLLPSLPPLIKPSIEERSIANFKDLELSEGILRSGVGRDIYINKTDGSDLLLLCADNAGKYMTQTCLDGRIRDVIGKRVTVYHEKPFKMSRVRAFFYEVRYNNMPLIRYKDVVESIRSRTVRGRAKDKDLSIMLMVLAFCSSIYVYFKWRHRERRPLEVDAR